MRDLWEKNQTKITIIIMPKYPQVWTHLANASQSLNHCDRGGWTLSQPTDSVQVRCTQQINFPIVTRSTDRAHNKIRAPAPFCSEVRTNVDDSVTHERTSPPCGHHRGGDVRVAVITAGHHRRADITAARTSPPRGQWKQTPINQRRKIRSA